MIGGAQWAKQKEVGMNDAEYQQADWWKEKCQDNAMEKMKLEMIRAAQKSQGDMEALKDNTYWDDTAELTRNALMDGLIMEQLMLDGNNERMAKRKAGKYTKSIKASYVDDIPWDNAVERGEAAM